MKLESPTGRLSTFPVLQSIPHKYPLDLILAWMYVAGCDYSQAINILDEVMKGNHDQR